MNENEDFLFEFDNKDFIHPQSDHNPKRRF